MKKITLGTIVLLVLSGCTMFMGTPEIVNVVHQVQYRAASSLDGDVNYNSEGGGELESDVQVAPLGN